MLGAEHAMLGCSAVARANAHSRRALIQTLALNNPRSANTATNSSRSAARYDRRPSPVWISGDGLRSYLAAEREEFVAVLADLGLLRASV